MSYNDNIHVVFLSNFSNDLLVSGTGVAVRHFKPDFIASNKCIKLTMISNALHRD